MRLLFFSLKFGEVFEIVDEIKKLQQATNAVDEIKDDSNSFKVLAYIVFFFVVVVAAFCLPVGYVW